MTALPTEDFREGEDLKLIPPTEYSINEGNGSDPRRILKKLLSDTAVKSS